MNAEQLWSGYFMAALANSNNRNVGMAKDAANLALKTHFAEWPEGDVASRERERAEYERREE